MKLFSWIKNHKLITAIIIIFIIGTFFYIQKPSPSQQVYIKAKATRGEINKNILVTAEVLPRSLISVNSQTEGKIKAIHIKMGDLVEKDQLLIELDSKKQENDLKNAQSKLNLLLKQKEVRILSHNLAKKRLEREKNLYSKKATSLDSLEQTKEAALREEIALEDIKSSITQAENLLDTAKNNLENTQIKSPERGYIISLPVNIGQTVNTNILLTQITNLDQVQLRMQISENDINQISIGMPIEYNFFYDPTTKHQAQIDEIDPAYTTISQGNYRQGMDIGSKAVYFYVTSFVENTNHQLRLGMSTQNTLFLQQKKDVITLPIIAIQTKDNQSMVRIEDENGVAQNIPVKVGISDDKNIEILSGIEEGQEVIISSGIQGEFTNLNEQDRGE